MNHSWIHQKKNISLVVNGDQFYLLEYGAVLSSGLQRADSRFGVQKPWTHLHTLFVASRETKNTQHTFFVAKLLCPKNVARIHRHLYGQQQQKQKNPEGATGTEIGNVYCAYILGKRMTHEEWPGCKRIKIKCPRRRAGILSVRCFWLSFSCNHVHKSLLIMYLGIYVLYILWRQT